MSNFDQTHMDAVLQRFRNIPANAKDGLFFNKTGENIPRGFVDMTGGGDEYT